MPGLSDATGTLFLNVLFNGEAVQSISRIWMSLHTADPGGSGANEVGSGVGYTRVEVTNAFPPAISPRLSNNVAITFPVATSQYVVTHIGFWESSTEILPDCFLYSQELAAPVTVAVGAPFSLAVGSVAIFSR